MNFSVPIGGECPAAPLTGYFYWTDSGRSSLRLILRSLSLKKKILLPDYLCESVWEVFQREKIQCRFYHVHEDFTVDKKDFSENDYGIVYWIDYFGCRRPLPDEIKKRNAVLIHDGVFSLKPENWTGIKRWIGFNSFRKISPVPEGSVVQSFCQLQGELIDRRTADFIRHKYRAQAAKCRHFDGQQEKESDYLQMFKQGERSLDQQTTIHRISDEGMFRLCGFYESYKEEQRRRRENFQVLDKMLKPRSVMIPPQDYSFYVLSVDDRDRLRDFLRLKNIFLPVHWPAVDGIDNPLYERLISIPLDSRYDEETMRNIARTILKFSKDRPT